METNKPSIHVIRNETINYNNSIVINSRKLSEVFCYSREFKTPHDIKVLTVKLDIPFTGNDTIGSRSRILLYLDDTLLCDGTMHNQDQWELKPLHLEGICVDVKPGIHKLKLMCCVDKGNLHIPHYHTAYIEHTIDPKISGKLVIIEQN